MPDGMAVWISPGKSDNLKAAINTPRIVDEIQLLPASVLRSGTVDDAGNRVAADAERRPNGIVGQPFVVQLQDPLIAIGTDTRALPSFEGSGGLGALLRVWDLARLALVSDRHFVNL